MPAVREKERLWVLMHTERQALTWLTVQQGSPLGFCWISVHAGFDGRYGCSVILWKFQPVGFLYSSWYSFSWELWLPASAGVPPPPPPPHFLPEDDDTGDVAVCSGSHLGYSGPLCWMLWAPGVVVFAICLLRPLLCSILFIFYFCCTLKLTRSKQLSQIILQTVQNASNYSNIHFFRKRMYLW